MKPGKQHKKITPQQTAQSTAQRHVISYRPPDPFGRDVKGDTAQCKVVGWEHKNNKYKSVALSYEKALDNAVDKAHKHVLMAPRLGISVDGHTDKWIEDWDNHINKNKVDLFAASFGYAIESLATNIYIPPAPSGFNIELQGVRGATRPDIILKEKGNDIAWLDITAENSEGHIWKKGPPFWDQQDHASEIAYPSLDNKSLTFMEGNDKNDKPKNFDPKAFEKQLAMAKKLSDAREVRWAKLGQEIRIEWQNGPGNGLRKGSTAPKLFYQTPMMKLLCYFFNLKFSNKIITYDGDLFTSDIHVDLNETGEAADLRREAPHILTALGLGTKPYGFLGGSRNRGRSWLMQYDTKMPQLADLKDDDNDSKKPDNDIVMTDKTK